MAQRPQSICWQEVRLPSLLTVACSVPCSRSVSSALPEVKKIGIFYESTKVYEVSKGPNGNVKLENYGGLDSSSAAAFYPAMLAPGSVDGGYCRMDNMSIELFRGGHLELDPECTTCTFMTKRGRQHRRQAEEETADATREVCADQTGRLPTPSSGSEYPLAALRSETRYGFVRALSNKRSEIIREAMVDMPLLLRRSCRFHSDERRMFMGGVNNWLSEHAVSSHHDRRL